MTLHAPGADVAIGPDGATVGRVLAVTVRGASRAVSYDVVWWDGATRRTEWLQDHEVGPLPGEHAPVGFTAELSR